jgi:cation/acetate symporter
MSAATLLGLTAMVYTAGLRWLHLHAVCFFAGWPIILFLMAERLRNLGKFTFADITAYRLDQGKVRTMAAIGSLTVVCFYLIAQMVGAGQLIKLLFGLDYNIAMVRRRYPDDGLCHLRRHGRHDLGADHQGLHAAGRRHAGDAAGLQPVRLLARESADQGHRSAQAGREADAPGSLLADPVTAISLGLGLMFGTAGLPHILMRFFTVTNAKEARKSVLYASGFVAYFFNVIFLMGLCAIIIVGQNPEFFEGGTVGGKIIGGGNMVAMHLAKAVGGNMLLGFLSAVAFATILAVVSGLALAGASAISHDIYARVIKKGNGNRSQEIRVSRFATIGLGMVAMLLGILPSRR